MLAPRVEKTAVYRLVSTVTSSPVPARAKSAPYLESGSWGIASRFSCLSICEEITGVLFSGFFGGILVSLIAVPLEPFLAAVEIAFGKNPFGEQSGLARLLKRPELSFYQIP